MPTSRSPLSRRAPLALAAAAALGSAAVLLPRAANAADTVVAAADAPTRVVISGSKNAPLAVPLPSTVETLDALQIEETVNTATTAGALQYLPSVHVRERYVGDRNGVLVMRVNSSVASAQTSVYGDGILLSNFLANSFSTAPRWGLVAPEEIDHIDIVYGPFSALYPGNSAGGVVRMVTRTPTRFEAHARLDLFTQRFREYGTDERFSGGHASVSLGDAQGAFTWRVALDHLDNHGHPQTFGAATAKPGAPAAAGTFTVVDASRVYRDTDTSGNPRIVVASTGIDHTTQDMAKLKLGVKLAPAWTAGLTLGVWQNASDTGVDSYLRDAAGKTVYNAGPAFANPLKAVRIDGADVTVAAAPSLSRSEHWLHAAELKSATGGAWDVELAASRYEQVKDLSRSATPTSGFDNGFGPTPPGGQLTDAGGTGWRTLDLRGALRLGRHTLAAGAHHDRYTLATATWGTAAAPIANWLDSETGALNTASYGQTQTRALYLQDEWRLAPAWTLIAGGRQEWWRAFDGSNYSASNAAPNPKNLVYADRSRSDFSPKLHLSWQATPAWTVRASVGKAVRYPTVAEMFQTFNGPGGVRFNDPNLLPEQVVSSEWVLQHTGERSLLRASLFTEEKTDALISQTDVTVTPTISSIQNVDRVRTRGVELVGQARDLGVRGLDLHGSLTWVHSAIVADSRNPGLVGSDQPRIPTWRATAVATWRASDAFSASLAWRFSGHQHNALLNTATGQYNDVNPDVYGAVSHYSVVDAKLLWRFAPRWTASLGVNNLGDFKYYVNPNPYPQRTWFTSLKYDL